MKIFEKISSFFRSKQNAEWKSPALDKGLTEELSRLKNEHKQAATEFSTVPVTPEDWPDQRPVFNFETESAHRYEALRDVFQIESRSQLIAIHERLNVAAGRLAGALELQEELQYKLQVLDEEINEEEGNATKFLGEKFSSFVLKSEWYGILRALVMVLIIFSELLMTGSAFNHAINSPIFSNAGYFVGLGVISLLVIVPDLMARALRSALLQRQLKTGGHGEVNGETESEIKSRNRKTTSGTSISIGATIFMGLLVLALVIPISVLRAKDTNPFYIWFPIYLISQLAFSSYFFLTEWLLGIHAKSMHSLEKRRKEMEAHSFQVKNEIDESIAGFHARAAEFVNNLLDYARGDSRICHEFGESMNAGRSIMTQKQPSAAAYISFARVPVLEEESAAKESGLNQDSIYVTHRSSQGETMRSRRFLLEIYNQLFPKDRFKTAKEAGEDSLFAGLFDEWAWRWLSENLSKRQELKKYPLDISTLRNSYGQR